MIVSLSVCLDFALLLFKIGNDHYFCFDHVEKGKCQPYMAACKTTSELYEKAKNWKKKVTWIEEELNVYGIKHIKVLENVPTLENHQKNNCVANVVDDYFVIFDVEIIEQLLVITDADGKHYLCYDFEGDGDCDSEDAACSIDSDTFEKAKTWKGKITWIENDFNAYAIHKVLVKPNSPKMEEDHHQNKCSVGDVDKYHVVFDINKRRMLAV